MLSKKIAGLFSCQRTGRLSAGGRIQPAVDIQPGWLGTDSWLNPNAGPDAGSEHPIRRIRDLPCTYLVENTGLEPVTSGLQSRRSPN
jgi:hypothetical protein